MSVSTVNLVRIFDQDGKHLFVTISNDDNASLGTMIKFQVDGDHVYRCKISDLETAIENVKNTNKGK